MGHHKWYEAAGKYLAKVCTLGLQPGTSPSYAFSDSPLFEPYRGQRNTFTDFIDCAQALVGDGVAKAGAITCEGRSAGGLLVGNVVNMEPSLFKAAVAGVPFVDLMTTMCDPSIPLTTEEWEEWGNPNEAKYHSYMQSY